MTTDGDSADAAQAHEATAGSEGRRATEGSPVPDAPDDDVRGYEVRDAKGQCVRLCRRESDAVEAVAYDDACQWKHPPHRVVPLVERGRATREPMTTDEAFDLAVRVAETVAKPGDRVLRVVEFDAQTREDILALVRAVEAHHGIASPSQERSDPTTTQETTT